MCKSVLFSSCLSVAGLVVFGLSIKMPSYIFPSSYKQTKEKQTNKTKKKETSSQWGWGLLVFSNEIFKKAAEVGTGIYLNMFTRLRHINKFFKIFFELNSIETTDLIKSVLSQIF